MSAGTVSVQTTHSVQTAYQLSATPGVSFTVAETFGDDDKKYFDDNW